MAIGLTDAKISLVMKGGRQLKADEADKIRRFFGFQLPEDLPPMIAVAGRVGAGDHIQLTDDYEKGAGLYQIERPTWIPSTNVVAAEINGGSAEPWALDGDIVFWRRDGMHVDPMDLGRPVIAETAEGQVMMKRLGSSKTPGKWSLLSINPAHANLFDVELRWASRVVATISRDEIRVISVD